MFHTVRARPAAAAQSHADSKCPSSQRNASGTQKDTVNPLTLRRGLISTVYASADVVHVGRTSVLAVSRGHLQARVGTVRPRHSVSLHVSTLRGLVVFLRLDTGNHKTQCAPSSWPAAALAGSIIHCEERFVLLADPFAIH